MSSTPPDPPLDLESYRNHLLVLARIGLDARLRRRVSAADIVQETLVEAYQALPAFRGDARSLLPWLRKILANNLINVARYHGREKRNLELERSMEAFLAESSLRLSAALGVEAASPSGAAMQEEAALALTGALAALPAIQAEVVILRHLHGQSLADIGATLGLNRYQVTQELRRATSALQRKLQGFA